MSDTMVNTAGAAGAAGKACAVVCPESANVNIKQLNGNQNQSKINVDAGSSLPTADVYIEQGNFNTNSSSVQVNMSKAPIGKSNVTIYTHDIPDETGTYNVVV
jgi:hypothetical protein